MTLNFCCMMRNSNSCPIKSSVKMFLLNEYDIESVVRGGAVQKAGYGGPQGGDRKKTGQALFNCLDCRENAAPPAFPVLLVRLMRDPEEK